MRRLKLLCLANCNFASHGTCHNVTFPVLHVIHFKGGLNSGEAQPDFFLLNVADFKGIRTG